MVNAKNKLSDLESIAEFKSNFELDKEADFFSKILALNADQNQKQWKKKLKANKKNAAK